MDLEIPFSNRMKPQVLTIHPDVKSFIDMNNALVYCPMADDNVEKRDCESCTWYEHNVCSRF
ncbi:hypothetical protein GCM10025859_47640 [Alicyclobacillus fastidiosus]|nr:hypothetical protein GCM10025859_47640 [Alicyclobacillus fastidiosus]